MDQTPEVQAITLKARKVCAPFMIEVCAREVPQPHAHRYPKLHARTPHIIAVLIEAQLTNRVDRQT